MDTTTPSSPAAPLDLKNTVHLPKTAFPMKANLAQLEPKLLEQWDKTGIYAQLREARKGQRTYILHDGPPYANGNIHLGHAFNKLLKDFIVKVKSMEGFDAPYVPGWDCHGLPIEIKVDGQLGSKKAQMTAAQIRGACRKYAEKYVNLQRRDFIRLGVFGRWADPYLTMSAQYESVIAGAFVDFLDKGYVYKGLKPVNWCIHDRTALAEAEVEYENHASPSVYVRFALKTDPAFIDSNLTGKNVFGLIWTTTPWTLPANLGIAFNPRFTYCAVDVNGDVYIVADELLSATTEACGWSSPVVIAKFAGEKLAGTVFQHPFLERDSVGLLGDHVTLEQGTGAVHTAPGHGQEDYVIGVQHGLPVYCPVDGAGRFFRAEGAAGYLPDELIGKSVWEGNAIVIGILEKNGALLSQRKIDHSYPHCWRCHNPTIFRATEQWFISMEHGGLRQKALDAIKKVKWNPAWGEERIGNMIATRPDWCISRQRAWGVPIIVFYCEGCHEPLTDRKILDRVVALFKEHTADVWYSKTVEELIGSNISCQKCSGAKFRKENDILDVWFDSGASHLAVLTPENNLPWPADMYLEGGDQYRGWFHSSLLVAVGLKGEAPYRASATNGWTLDGEGHALSKSKGAEEVEKVINKYGAELLRLWTASVDFTEDVRFSDTIVSRLIEAYRKLRNTFRYALGNLHDFDPEKDAVPVEQMLEIDRWILSRTEELIKNCRAFYDENAFHKVYRAIYDFATTDLSSIYFDVLKDRLYTAATNSRARRSGQTALYKVHYALTRLAAPLLAFTTEEVWSYTKKPAGAPESVHLARLPEAAEVASGLDSAALDKWERLMEIRDRVLLSLEGPRKDKTIGSSLEAGIYIESNDLRALLQEYERDLPALFITSQVTSKPPVGSDWTNTRLEVAPLSTGEKIQQIVIYKADGIKCERCWKYSTAVGQDPKFPTVCDGCADALREMGY